MLKLTMVTAAFLLMAGSANAQALGCSPGDTRCYQAQDYNVAKQWGGLSNQQVSPAFNEQWLQNNRTSNSYGGDPYYNHSGDPYDDHQ